MPRDILPEDVPYPVVCHTESLDTASHLTPRIWVNERFNTVKYYLVFKTMVYKVHLLIRKTVHNVIIIIITAIV